MLLSFLLLTAPVAHAAVFGGSPGNSPAPTPSVRIEVPGAVVEGAYVDLQEIVLHACGGGTVTVSVGEVLDLAEDVMLTVPVGDWCDVEFRWAGPGWVEGDQGGQPFLTQTYDTATVVPVDEIGGVATFAQVSGLVPELVVAL